MLNTPAPIALFVYNRPWHTRRTVEALCHNELAAGSDLFVFSDGPRSNADLKAVQEIREYLRSIAGFHQVTIIERDRNLGLAQSIISGVTEIVNRSGRIIVLEDDMVTSPYFLKYINEALELYKDENRVISIHGYIYPIKNPLPETFFIKLTGCWGWGTWKRGWDLFEPDGKILLKELEIRKLTKKFDMNGSYIFTQMLRDQTKGKNNSWAIRWQASAFLNDKLTLFPGSSHIRNIGNDGSGIHCGKTDCFHVELACSPVYFEKIPIEESQDALKEIENYFKSIRANMLSTIIHRAYGRCKHWF
jgi:hypothetical protein